MTASRRYECHYNKTYGLGFALTTYRRQPRRGINGASPKGLTE
jgi:hypothetical protein